MSFTNLNHYVPRWYQRRFLPQGVGERKLFYLDLQPEQIRRPDGSTYFRETCRRLGPDSCFAQNHLYTMFFGERASDVIEQRFFGEIDSDGAKAADFFLDY